jgi:hypothetical protein
MLDIPADVQKTVDDIMDEVLSNGWDWSTEQCMARAVLADRENRWTDWAGGPCPVLSSAGVDVRFRDGDTDLGVEAGDLRWKYLPNEMPGDIVAYRLISKP